MSSDSIAYVVSLDLGGKNVEEGVFSLFPKVYIYPKDVF